MGQPNSLVCAFISPERDLVRVESMHSHTHAECLYITYKRDLNTYLVSRREKETKISKIISQ